MSQSPEFEPQEKQDQALIPLGDLPPMQCRDLPPPPVFRAMLGPGIILAGLALGSGEFILWPYITFRSQFVFFWACLVGVTMQYFINMEISRWTLATGETAVTGFCRMNRHWAWVFLLMNVIPWSVPAWATSAAEITGWLIWGTDATHADSVKMLAIGGLLLCGVVLTAGPVIYETVEKMQGLLVAIVMLLVITLSVWLLKDRPDAIWAQMTAVATLGYPEFVPDLEPTLLLGALAFAGAGGTLNLAQSDYIKEKGYGMGYYIGRMTSPITGKPEPTSEFGFQFAQTGENMRRWRIWWRNASLEHLLSFFATCVICLVLLTSIAYCLTYDASGQPKVSAGEEVKGLQFILVQAGGLEDALGKTARILFLLMGIAVLLTTEFGVLDAATRISTNVVKVAWLRENTYWTESRLYYVLLWSLILLGCVLLFQAGTALQQLTIASALNGGVMFIYSITLIYLNRRYLRGEIRMPIWRLVIMVIVVAFFGFFSLWASLGLLQSLSAG